LLALQVNVVGGT